MKHIISSLQKSKRAQIFLFIMISFLNVTIIGTFMQLIFEVNKIKKQTSVVSRDEELEMYFMSIMMISMMIILFSTWIIRIINQTIFHSRRNFNIQLKLAGLSSDKLSAIYIKEALNYQKFAIPLGILLMQVIYHVISRISDIDNQWVEGWTIVLALMLHIAVTVVCLAISLRKETKFNPVEEMRSQYKTEGVRRIQKMDYMKAGIGLFIIVASLLMEWDEIFEKICPIIGIFMMMDLVIVLFQYIVKQISKQLKLLPLYLSHLNILGYYKKIDPIFSTLIVGIMLSIGLSGVFNTARTISRDTVEQNLYFETLIINSEVKEKLPEEVYQKMVEEIDPGAKVAYGINLEMLDDEGVVNTLYAVDSSYTRYGEKMVLVSGEDVSSHLDDKTFDGIYLPDYFISDDEIGNEYSLSINGNKVTFKIAGRFHANGSRGRYGFVSKSYLQEVMGLSMVNSIYIAEGSKELIRRFEQDENVIHSIVITKESIANNSYQNSISGTEIFEIGSWVVILISMLMMIHYYSSTSAQNVMDISRLRAMGISTAKLKRTYTMQALSIITQSFIIGTLLSYLFIGVGVKMIVNYVDVPVKIMLPVPTILVVYVMVMVVAGLASYLSVRKAFGSNYVEYLSVING